MKRVGEVASGGDGECAEPGVKGRTSSRAAPSSAAAVAAAAAQAAAEEAAAAAAAAEEAERLRSISDLASLAAAQLTSVEKPGADELGRR